MLLAIVLIIFGERVLFDLNRSLNPHAVTESEYTTLRTSDSAAISTLSSERSAVSAQRVYFPRENESDYKLYEMLIHSAFVIPVFLVMFVLYFWVWFKKSDSPFKVVVVGYLVFAFWMMLHLIFEIGGYVLEEYKNLGVYLVLIFLAAIFTMLMVMLQRKVNRHRD